MNSKNYRSLSVLLAAIALALAVAPAYGQIQPGGTSGPDTGYPTNGLALSSDTNALQRNIELLQLGLAESALSAAVPFEDPGTNQLTEELPPLVVDASLLRQAALMGQNQDGFAGPTGLSGQTLSIGGHIININFANQTKVGPAAVGQNATDYWNPCIMPGYSYWLIQNVLWSDQTASTVDIAANNAPGQWASAFCVDPMYRSFVYPWNSGHITVEISQLPAGTYDFFVYAVRASENGAPVAELKRAGVSLSIKGTSLWGKGWYQTWWDEHEQYVRFRNVAINTETVLLDLYPDSTGLASLSGLQIVPSSYIPSEQPAITRLLNVDFAGSGSKVGPAAVGTGAGDFWNVDTHSQMAATLSNLKWADQSSSSVSMTVLNGPGNWGNAMPDLMLRKYKYSNGGGNMVITLNGLPSGVCNLYLYGHTPENDNNSLFELWSDDVNWGIKSTSLVGSGPSSATWEVGQQYVLFKDVTVTAGKPVTIHVNHTTYGYDNISGLQVAYTGDADTDADGLPDGWERRYFSDLSQTATGDFDSDGLTNLREYQLGTDPTRADSDANGLSDLMEFETVWVEDAVPQGGYQSGTSESWSWVSSFWDGTGWGGGTVYPHSGRWWTTPLMHVSANVPNAAHQHYFYSSVSTMRPASGDVLYAWVNLDPTYPPSEVMLQWFIVGDSGSASWEQRAYWGANNMTWGADGTAARRYMGPLPAAGSWVRLEVPASAVRLEGKIVEGMAFVLYGGRAAWDSAGTMKVDRDGDGLPDSWEMQHFGNLLQGADGDPDGDGLTNVQEYELGTSPVLADTDGNAILDGDEDFDGDGLSNAEEVRIPLDALYPTAGHLNPLNPRSGRAGQLDGDLDSDHDGLSNLAELRKYHSDPANAHSFNNTVTDAQYLFMAAVQISGGPPPAQNTRAKALQVILAGNRLQFTITQAPPGARYDLYYSHDLAVSHSQWRRFYSEIVCDASGTATFIVDEPDTSPGAYGFFVILSADDGDGDGLSDGYEAWLGLEDTYDSDSDQLSDGWEVEYGLDPKDSTGDNGANGNPDGDMYFDGSATVPLINLVEYYYYNASVPSYDPLKAYGTPANRPVVTIRNSTANPYCPQASFTITRYAGEGGNSTAGDLTVYYSVGGTLHYGDDYTLSPPPPPADFPRIYSATIPDGSQEVTVTVSLQGNPVQSGVQTVAAAITPYGVSTVPQRLDPGSWAYVTDWGQNRAVITFDFENLRPLAYDQTLPACPDTDTPITLTGWDGCNDPLTFSIVGQPQHGTLLGTAPNVTYRPSSGYTGPDSFTFVVNDGVRDSAPGTISLTVGDTPMAYDQSVQTCRNTDQAFSLSGHPGCGALAYIIASQPSHGVLLGTAPNLTYRPNTGYEGPDSFTFKVNNGYTDSDVATVTIEVGYAPTAGYQSRVTDTSRQIDITLTGSDQCNDPLTYSIQDFPVLGTLNGTPPNVMYTPGSPGDDPFTFIASDGVRQSAAGTVSVTVLPLPVLTMPASCRPHGVMLEWTLPEWVNTFLQGGFLIYRATTSGGPYGAPIATAAAAARSFEDTTVLPGTTYYYVIGFQYLDPGDGSPEAFSNETSGSTCCNPTGGFWTDKGPTAQQLAEWLAPPGATVGNVSFTGFAGARGAFGGGLSAGLPFDAGVILSSGDISLAKGPNLYSGEAQSGADANVANNGPSDAQLEALLNTVQPPSARTFDAAVLEFDLTPSAGGTLGFDYIFASEEYPEFLVPLKNDAVAIFVDGQNIAWIPGTADPICLFTVNNGRNADYFRANPLSPDSVFALSYDGFTSTSAHPYLRATVAIQAGVMVHLKIVIADENDQLYDSAVFIRANRTISCP